MYLYSIELLASGAEAGGHGRRCGGCGRGIRPRSILAAGLSLRGCCRADFFPTEQRMKSFWIPLAGLLLLASAAPARADIAPAPCDGKQVGDACTTYDNKPGTCVDNPMSPGVLDCQETMAATGTGGSSSGTGGSSSGEGGGSSGGGDDDSGCAVHPGAGQGATGLLLLLAASALARRRRR